MKEITKCLHIIQLVPLAKQSKNNCQDLGKKFDRNQKIQNFAKNEGKSKNPKILARKPKGK